MKTIQAGDKLEARSVYDQDAFSQRVHYAKKCIIAGNVHGRAFDTCFEMCDGDVVVVALYRKSLEDAQLQNKLFSCLCKESVMGQVEKHRDIPTNRLYIAARQARARFNGSISNNQESLF